MAQVIPSGAEVEHLPNSRRSAESLLKLPSIEGHAHPGTGEKVMEQIERDFHEIHLIHRFKTRWIGPVKLHVVNVAKRHAGEVGRLDRDSSSPERVV